MNGNGGGGSGNGGPDSATIDSTTGHQVLVASDSNTTTNAANRDYAQPVYTALDGPFVRPRAASSARRATASFSSTPRTRSRGRRRRNRRERRPDRAVDPRVGRHGRCLPRPRRYSDRGSRRRRGLAGLAVRKHPHRLPAGLAALRRLVERPSHAEAPRPHHGAAEPRSRTSTTPSANVIKASEDKTFPGAIVASLASPWGQAVSAGDPANTYFGSYREVFARDLYEAWTGLLADGDLATARAATLFLLEHQQLADGSLPRNSLVNGKTAPDSFNTQLDETAYPILMAQQLGLHRRHAVRRPHQARGELPDRPWPVVRPRTVGGAERATRPRRSPQRSPVWSPRPTSPTCERRPALGRGLARRRRRLAALDQGMDRDDERSAVDSRTSSGCRRPATPTRPSSTTSATAARRSTSAR